MQGVGHDEQDGGDVNDEDEAPGWYLPASLIIAEADCLVPVQGYPHQAQAGDVDARSLAVCHQIYGDSMTFFHSVPLMDFCIIYCFYRGYTTGYIYLARMKKY